MIENPSMCGNGALGCQLPVSIRQVPAADIVQSTSTFLNDSGHEPASTRTICLSQSITI